MALVKPFSPEVDPWETQQSFDKQSGRVYPWPSQQGRSFKYAIYYDDYEFWHTYQRRTHKPLSIQRLSRLIPGTEIEVGYYRKFDLKAVKPMRISELVRKRHPYPDDLRLIYKVNQRYGQYFCFQKQTYFTLLKETRAAWRTLTTEQKHIWQWMAFVQKQDSKPAGWTWFQLKWSQAHKHGWPSPVWPCHYTPQVLYMPLLMSFAFYRGDEYSATFALMFSWELNGYGQKLRTNLTPSVRKEGTGGMIDRVYYPGWFPEIGSVFFYMCHGTKRQQYLIRSYAVDDWGHRVPGEWMWLPGDHNMYWSREYWDWYWDVDEGVWVEFVPPQLYDYEGGW